MESSSELGLEPKGVRNHMRFELTRERASGPKYMTEANYFHSPPENREFEITRSVSGGDLGCSSK